MWYACARASAPEVTGPTTARCAPSPTMPRRRAAAWCDARNNRLTASGIARPSPDAARAPALSARNDWRAACRPQTERGGTGAPRSRRLSLFTDHNPLGHVLPGLRAVR